MNVRIEFKREDRNAREITNVLMAHSSSVRTAIPTFAVGHDNRNEFIVALTKDSVITDIDENGTRDEEMKASDAFPELLTSLLGYRLVAYWFDEIDKAEITF